MVLILGITWKLNQGDKKELKLEKNKQEVQGC